MKIEIKGIKYGFLWGTKCLIQVQKDLGVDINVFLGSLTNPEVLTVLIYNGLKLSASKNGVDLPFTDLQDFVEQYDDIFKPEEYQHIITDLLESMYMGDHLHSYITAVYGIEFNDLDESSKAKKKYLLTLDKSSLTSQAGGSKVKKLTTARSRSTKSTDTEMK